MGKWQHCVCGLKTQPKKWGPPCWTVQILVNIPFENYYGTGRDGTDASKVKFARRHAGQRWSIHSIQTTYVAN